LSESTRVLLHGVPFDVSFGCLLALSGTELLVQPEVGYRFAPLGQRPAFRWWNTEQSAQLRFDLEKDAWAEDVVATLSKLRVAEMFSAALSKNCLTFEDARAEMLELVETHGLTIGQAR
jgi:hypothetical protein